MQHQPSRHQQLAATALARYDLAGSRLILLQADRPIVFKVITQQKDAFVLRIYEGASPSKQAVWWQCQWLRAIRRDTDLIAPEPIAADDGEDVPILKMRGQAPAFCTLTRWVIGTRRFRRNGPGTKVLREVGRIMAKLHLHGQEFRPPTGFRCPRWDWKGLFGSCSPWWPQVPRSINASTDHLFDEAMRLTRRAMNSLGAGPKVFGLIHGDLMQANYIVHGNSVAAIDFGDFGRGHFLYDMAVTLLMLKPFDAHGKQRDAFLAGYREIRPLSSRHERLLDLFIVARAVVLARMVLGSRKPDPNMLLWTRKTLPWIKKLLPAYSNL